MDLRQQGLAASSRQTVSPTTRIGKTQYAFNSCRSALPIRVLGIYQQGGGCVWRVLLGHVPHQLIYASNHGHAGHAFTTRLRFGELGNWRLRVPARIFFPRRRIGLWVLGCSLGYPVSGLYLRTISLNARFANPGFSRGRQKQRSTTHFQEGISRK